MINAFLSNELEYEAIESGVKPYLRAKAPEGLIGLTRPALPWYNLRTVRFPC
jgi:hypothetical protein